MDNITKLPARFLLAATLILLPLAARATNYYGGILNASLGNAVLSVQGTTLKVDNIAHSGNDGVKLDVGSASALDIQFFEYLKHQTCMVTIATSDAYAPFPVVSVGELFGGSNSYARADFSALGSTQSMMQVRDGNGNLLSSARVANAAWVSLDNLFPNPTNGIYVYQVQQGADFTWWRFCTPCLVCTEQVAVVERTLCFRPLDVRRRIPHISGLQLKALGDTAVTSLTLSNENLGLFGHFHHALGQARFDARGDTLGVLNLGSSGNDGVSVLLGRGMNRLKARWNELDPAGAAPPGASFTMAARGSFTGGVQQALGSMKIQKTAAGMALVNDFTGIGSQSALILVMRNGAQVASFRLNHNTPLPFTGGWPRSGTVGPRLTDLWPPYGPICFYEDWPIDVVIPVAGGSIVGNQIRVLIDDVPLSFAALDAVHFTLGGLPQLVLAGEESSPAGLIFDGLVHAPLGNATLQANVALESLTVSGIGSNGTDGVRILTGGGGGASTKLGVFNPDLLPIDAFLHWAAIDPTDLTLEALTVRRTAAGGALYADFGGLGASTATVALYSNDVLLAYAKGIPPTTPVLTFSGGGGGLPINLDPCILHPEDCYGAIDINIWQPDPIGPIASLVSLPGREAARGTRVTIQPDALPVAPAAIQVREIQVTGKNLGTMSLGNSFSVTPPEGLVYFGLKHHVLGQAQYSFDTPEALAVENLGSSGNDGVDVQIQELVQSPMPGGPILAIGSPRNAYSVDWVALNPQPFPPGGVGGGLVFNAWGRLNGGPEQLVAWACQMFAGSSLQLVPDFSALGSGSQEIQLWRDGTLLTRYRVPNNTPAVTTAEWLSGLQLRPASGNFVPPSGPICFYGDWPIVVDVLTPSGEHFMANQVRIAIDDVPGSLDALTHVSLQLPGPQRLVFIREAASRVGLNFAGNQHFALGQARLSKTATGALMMENIGPSGSDGMEIQLGRAGFCEVASPSLPLPPPDSSCRYDYRAVVDGLSDRTAATLTMGGSAAVGGMQFVADMSPLGATRYTMLVLDGESQVAGLSNQPVATLTISDSTAYIAPSLRWDIQRYKCFIRIRVPKLPGNPGPLIRLGGGAPVSGDNVIILPDDPTRNLGAQTRVLLTATASAVHPEPKLFVTEQLGLFSVGHTGLGNATLQARGDTLTIGNLGSSGNDGVALELERSRSFLASFAPFDFQTAQGPFPSPWIQARAFGRFSGMPDHDLGSLRFTALTAGVVRVEADFTPVGSSNHIVEVWRSGALMLRVAGHTGVVATVNAWPAGIGKLGGTDPTVLPCYISPFAALVPITIGGGPTVDGDELRVLTGNPAGPIEELQRLQFQTSGFESFTIENERSTPALTPRFSQISRLSGGSLQLNIPTVFGYNYSLEAVDAMTGPHPWPWSTFETFFGDGSVKSLVIPATGPRRFIRLRVE